MIDSAEQPGTGSSSGGNEYVVIARRYRPQTFDELIGQQHVARALEQAIASDRVGHAYLFTGARGVGKTSAARILAKALNCDEGPTPTPCNECDVCRSVATGDDVDVLEIDGASNRGIDEIRQLAAERVGAAEPGAVQDLHHRRSPHAHQGGVQRALEDARRAARAREVHLRHDRGEQDSDHDPLAVPAVRLRGHRHGGDPNAARRRSPRPRASRSSRRRCRFSPAGPPARCATANRSWNSCCRCRQADHGRRGACPARHGPGRAAQRAGAAPGSARRGRGVGGAGRGRGRRRRNRATAGPTDRLLPRRDGGGGRLLGPSRCSYAAAVASGGGGGDRPATRACRRSWRWCRFSTRRPPACG